jgi:histone-lysine N-methyltransferase SUV420H
LQGSVVPLPDAWREEMDISDGFGVEAEGNETTSEDEGDGEEEVAAGALDEDEQSVVSGARRDKGKGKADERLQGQRRSDRTKRRDFSIVWSGLKRCYQLFLGPGRFLNVSVAPVDELTTARLRSQRGTAQAR